MKILGIEYLLVTMDAESFYGKGCTLTVLNTFGYITHPEFTLHGWGVKLDDAATVWFDTTEEALNYVDAEASKRELPIALLCHNTGFDGYILHHFEGWHPDLYLDTMGMSRGLFPTESASLEKLAERLWPNDQRMRKGKELINFRDVTTDAIQRNPALQRSMTNYCVKDVDLTYAAFIRMEPHFPDQELELIELHIRMKCDPVFVIDVPRVQKCLDTAIAERAALIENSGVAESTLSSNAKFERWLEKHNIPVPMKPSPTQIEADGTPKLIAALGKSDEGFHDLRRLYPEHEAVWKGRVATKSVGEITRAERFIATAEQCEGLMPGCLTYFAAHTGRSGGCLTADTKITTLSYGEITEKPITAVLPEDLVWDGAAFVAHGGVVFSGIQEVIEYDGITATYNHIVFTEAGAEKPISKAREDGDSIQVPRRPGQLDVDLALTE